jgi:hypothetical protein
MTTAKSPIFGANASLEVIVVGDEETAALEVGDAAFEEGEPVLEPGFAFGRGGLVGEFLFATGEAFLPAGEHGIGCRGFFRPAITRVWLIVAGVDDVVGHRRQAVAIRAIGHHVHFRLHQKHRPVPGRAELQDGFAIVEIVFGEQFVERVRVAPHPRGLVRIELAEP